MATVYLGPLRVFLLGGTGRTGRAVIDLALERGHEVTAVARSPEKLGAPRQRLNALGGDVTSEEVLRELLPGHDAVISALGHRGLGKDTICADSARALVAAMREVGPTRLLVVSLSTLFDGGWLNRLLRKTAMKHICADAVDLERIVQESQLEWTIARPPWLTQRGTSGGYRAEDGGLPEHARSVSRRDLARFLLDEAERPSHLHRVVGLGGARSVRHPSTRRPVAAH